MPKIGSIGIPELLIILVVVLLIFGPRRLPDMAKGLGQSVREFRKGLRDMRKEFDDEANDNDKPQANAGAPVSAATTSGAGAGSSPAASEAVAAPAAAPTPHEAAPGATNDEAGALDPTTPDDTPSAEKS